ncbi:Suppressor of Sensor Kinase (SLN1) [Allomyces arbusculus]|nr:Suppressor of Sensor Kinase (SLN1) [Allomyces arbusculus]
MVGILLNKLRHLGKPASAPAASPARPSDATVHAADYDDDLFHLACLKLAIFMYHPHERAKYIRYKRRLPHARDLRSRFIYKHDAADDPENTPRHSRASRGSRSRSQSSLASSTKRSHSRLGRVAARSRAATHQRDHSPAESALSLKSDQQLSTAPLYPLGPAPPPPPPPPPDGTTTPNGSTTPARRSSAAAKWLHKHLPRTSSWIARLNPPADSRDSASILDLGPDDEDDDEDDFLVVHLAKPDLANDEDDDGDSDNDDAQPAPAPTSATADPPPPQTNNRSSDAASLASMGDSPTRSSTDIHVRDGLRWRLEELIGQGAVGLVYRATLIPDPPLTPVSVAVKHLHLPSTNPHLNRRNFEQLIAALSLADHPNIITYLGSHIMDDDCFLLMELCEGGTLSDWIRRNGPLRDRARLVEYIRQMMSGLEFMHRHGVIHRDLKPSNIFFKDGVLKIADFSSAKFHGLCCRKVHDARVVGTPSYLAPEIVAGHQLIEIKGAQDIWSLGCSIYELIMGKPPFSEVDNVWSLYFGSYASINIPPPRPSSRLRAIFGLRPLNGTATATTPTSTPSTPPIKFTTPAAPLVPAKPAAPSAPLTADPDSDDDAPSPLDTVQSEGIPALLGGAATLRRQQYRYTARDAVGLDSAHEQALVVTPCDEDEDPLAKVEIPAELTTLSRQRSEEEGERDVPPAGAIVGNDAQGYVMYKFLEPLFPMVKNHHPLLSQLCQAGAVDPVALDFMAKCLAWDPRARGTAAQLLAHPLLRVG